MKRRDLLAALSLPGLAGVARAQAYPARVIRYIVPVAAGGGSDFIGRTVTERWARLIGQAFVVLISNEAQLYRFGSRAALPGTRNPRVFT